MSAIAARMRAERKQKAIRSHKKGGKPQQLAATLNRSPLDWGAEGERSIGFSISPVLRLEAGPYLFPKTVLCQRIH